MKQRISVVLELVFKEPMVTYVNSSVPAWGLLHTFSIQHLLVSPILFEDVLFNEKVQIFMNCSS